MADKTQVIEVFKKLGKPLKPGDIAKELGIESKEVSVIIKQLKDEGTIHSPKRCFYALK